MSQVVSAPPLRWVLKKVLSYTHIPPPTHTYTNSMAAMASADLQILAENHGIPTPPHPCLGDGCIIFNEDESKYFVIPGDRHHWPEGVKALWEALFHPADEFIKGAPFQVITVQNKLTFLGKDYDAGDQAGAIVEYCITKGWFPKCCFTKDAAVEIAKSGEDYAYTVDTEQLLNFHAQLMEFTALVKDHHYLENPFGGVEGGPTTDPAKIWDCLMAEGMEESGMLLTMAQFLCYSAPRASRKTVETTVTAFFIAHVDEEEMIQAYEARMSLLGTNHWQCPLPWYKALDVDQVAAKAEKANCETLNGAFWHPYNPEGHRLMDAKNKAIVQAYASRKEVEALKAPSPKCQSRPCWPDDGPEAKRMRLPAPFPVPPAPRVDINVRMFGSPRLVENPEDDVADFLSMADDMSPKFRLHLMVNQGVTPLLGEHLKLPNHPVPIGTEGLYMGEPAKVTAYDGSLPTQYSPAGEEFLLTVEWEGGRVRIPKTMFMNKVTGVMWVE